MIYKHDINMKCAKFRSRNSIQQWQQSQLFSLFTTQKTIKVILLKLYYVSSFTCWAQGPSWKVYHYVNEELY